MSRHCSRLISHPRIVVQSARDMAACSALPIFILSGGTQEPEFFVVGERSSNRTRFFQRANVSADQMPTLRPLQHASDDSHFHVNDRRAYAGLASPFPESYDILRRDLGRGFLLEEFARFDQELPLFLLAGLAQLQLSPIEIAFSSCVERLAWRNLDAKQLSLP